MDILGGLTTDSLTHSRVLQRESLSRQEPFVKQVELLLYLELSIRRGGSILGDRLIVPVFKYTSVGTLRRALFICFTKLNTVSFLFLG
jgi:hypothetical protein